MFWSIVCFSVLALLVLWLLLALAMTVCQVFEAARRRAKFMDVNDESGR